MRPVRPSPARARPVPPVPRRVGVQDAPVPPAADAEHTAAISKADLFGDDEPARTPDRTGDVAAVAPAHDRAADRQRADQAADRAADQVGDDGWDDDEWDDEAHWSDGDRRDGADEGGAYVDEAYDDAPTTTTGSAGTRRSGPGRTVVR